MFQVHSTDVQSSTRSYPTPTTTQVRDWRAEAVAAYPPGRDRRDAYLGGM